MRFFSRSATLIVPALFLLLSYGCSNERATGNTLLNAVSSDPELSMYSDLISTANMEKLLLGTNNLTLLVPNNAAFEALPEGKLEELKSSRSDLKDLLRYHVLPGKMGKLQLTSQGAIRSLSGQMIPVNNEGDEPSLGGATLVKSGIETTNGLVHVIDKVMMPPKDE